MARRWEPEDVALLRKLVAAGATRARLCSSLRRGWPSIYGKLEDIGLPRPALTSRVSFQPSVIAPTPRANDNLAHCLAIYHASEGRGFPFWLLPPKQRIAA